jgi:glyoxylase-like metal-dependent hydrolase (beta-lactamase superfamily II)
VTAFICETCGVQHADSEREPERCAICEDERQYVGWGGQRFTTMKLLREQLRADIREEEPGLSGIGTSPPFAIGQRALLVQTNGGNVLWDCISLLNDELLEYCARVGGVARIAISHPHYYSSMVDWAHAFGARVYLHSADRQWVMKPDRTIEFWEGDELELDPGITLLRCGGHFAGGTVLHWAAGQGGGGALLSGDIVQVVQDRRWVSFMRSYPNLIPLSAVDVRQIVARLAPYPFQRIYGAWYGSVVAEGAKEAVTRSADRYVRALDSGVISPGC